MAGSPLATPSANPSGQLSPTQASHVLDYFVNEPNLLIVDGGPCPRGIESTIVELSSDQDVIHICVRRVGATPQEDISRTLKDQNFKVTLELPRADTARLLYYSEIPFYQWTEGDTKIFPCNEIAFIDFSMRFKHLQHHFLFYKDLSEVGDVEEAAANLFGVLHQVTEARKSKPFLAALVNLIPRASPSSPHVAIFDRLEKLTGDKRASFSV